LKNTSPQQQSSQLFGRKILKENDKKEDILRENCEVKRVNNAKGAKPKQRRVLVQ
jgi:hypothetical protein